MPGQQRNRRLLVAGVQLHRGEPVGCRLGGALRPAQVVVGNDEVSEPAAGGNLGKCRANATSADEQYAHSCDPRPSLTWHERYQL